MYRHVAEAWRTQLKMKQSDLRTRAIAWRRQPTILRIERPSRLDRARALGYKAKQGHVVVRIRVVRGGMRRKRPVAGRRQKHLGVVRIKAAVSMKEVAQRRAAEKFPNLFALGSYPLYRDGKYAWYEVIFIDPSHPRIRKGNDASKLPARLLR